MLNCICKKIFFQHSTKSEQKHTHLNSMRIAVLQINEPSNKKSRKWMHRILHRWWNTSKSCERQGKIGLIARAGNNIRWVMIKEKNVKQMRRKCNNRALRKRNAAKEWNALLKMRPGVSFPTQKGGIGGINRKKERVKISNERGVKNLSFHW